jgi:hypothetical protein
VCAAEEQKNFILFSTFHFLSPHRAGCRLRNQYIGFLPLLFRSLEHKKLSKRAGRHASHFENKFTRALPCLSLAKERSDDKWLGGCSL